MKNVFMSILLVFSLVLSMIGNVNLVDAEPIVTLESLSYDPETAIIGLDNQVEVSFSVVNTGDEDANIVVTSTANDKPYREGSGFLNTPEGNLFEGNIVAGGEEPVSFPVTGLNGKNEGDYIGTIRISVEGQDDVTSTYTIKIRNLIPRVAITSGLIDNELVISSEDNNRISKKVTLQNNGNVDLNSLKMNFQGTFTDGSETIGLRVKFGEEAYREVIIDSENPQLIDMPALAAGDSLAVEVEANIPSDIELDTYTGNIVVSSNEYEAQEKAVSLTTPLLIKIEPEVCTDGRVHAGNPVDGSNSGNGLRIRITDPDDGDDFKISDEISISVEVENKESKDLDVIVEATLYDLDDASNVENVESDSITIDKNEKEDFDLTMEVPNDQDIDPDHTYILYVKAYEDGDEDQNCNYDSIEVELKRESDDVIISTFTINPKDIVNQGDAVSFRVFVENIGKDDQSDVYITLRNAELGLDLTSEKFNVKKYSKSDNDYPYTSSLFTIPSDAEAKDYYIEAVVYFDRERETRNSVAKLTVLEKEEDPGLVEPPVTPPANEPGTYKITTNSILDSLGSTKTLFIIGDIVLVILAVLFLVLIFKKR